MIHGLSTRSKCIGLPRHSVTVEYKQHVVEDGRTLTSAGISAGIDMALREPLIKSEVPAAHGGAGIFQALKRLKNGEKRKSHFSLADRQGWRECRKCRSNFVLTARDGGNAENAGAILCLL